MQSNRIISCSIQSSWFLVVRGHLLSMIEKTPFSKLTVLGNIVRPNSFIGQSESSPVVKFEQRLLWTIPYP